jgi:hypothetical protein
MESAVSVTAAQRIAQLAGRCAFDWNVVAQRMQGEAEKVLPALELELDSTVFAQLFWNETRRIYS